MDDLEGKYRPLLELGQGGTASVHLAVARGPSGFSKLVVLKTPKRIYALDPEFRRMFLNEGRLAARLNHANIVQTNEVFEENGHPIIVMEYLEGQPLSNVLAAARGQLPLAMHLRIIAQALLGLHHAHELEDFDGAKLNVVHRDMTPHNIFVTYDGHVKILDFGIAKLDRSSDYHTETGVIKGKIRYMSPEQMASEKLDRRADIYSIGVLLWEAATQERMWKDVSEPMLMSHVMNGEVPSPKSVKPNIPEALEHICMKALATEREDRYDSAAQLAADLEAVIDDLGTRVTSREIGKLLCTLFADERAATKQATDERLRQVAALSFAAHDPADAEAQSTTGVRTIGTRSYAAAPSSVAPAAERSSVAPTAEPSSVAPAAERSSVAPAAERSGAAPAAERSGAAPAALFPLLVVAAAACAIAGVTFWRSEAAQSAPERAEAPNAAAPPAESRSDNEQSHQDIIAVRISAVPSEAKLFFDDEPLTTNPFAAHMARDSTVHRVRAEMRGYVSAAVGLVLDKDANLVFTLEREKEAAPAPPRVSKEPRIAKPATAPHEDCSPPYYFDAQGIKKFKPTCL